MIIALTLILFTIGICVAAAVSDFLHLKIPNLLSGLIIAAFIATALLDHTMDLDLFYNIQTNLIIGGLTFIVMLICFFTGVLGGGDAKMISALSLWMGIIGLPVFLMVTTITGAILAVLSIAIRKTTKGQDILTRLYAHEKLQNGWVGAMKHEKNALPYGIAIACGAVGGLRAAGLLP
jgi:prepilin peptidase CpaA